MIVPTVDLRPDLLPIRHQRRRQSCLAFASSTAHEHQARPGEHFSVEFLFYHAVARTPGSDPSAGTTMAATASALADAGQPVETAWPYSPIQVAPWAPPAVTTTLHKATIVPGKFIFGDIIAALDQGRPIILGLVITDAFYRPDVFGRVRDENPDTERGGHAVLAIGHNVGAGGTPALLIRNSWGESWGLGGYAWLSRAYVDRQLHETAVLT
ncbi:C1 family peptidase [Limobrevibacterium gyesilva]|uniref:C1 family peptidase n=1 Tax=Limobrevibacterium gyesilva TaxID=2991712 RepID=A0AA42CFC9_9PROT|nr:C1 family peptidase [Limobrevibacterium gyesilva]MCW3474691.1 C1 family peptidase [Limobrevibacterium gyesilva]